MAEAMACRAGREIECEIEHGLVSCYMNVRRVATGVTRPLEQTRVGERSSTEEGMSLSRHRRTRLSMRSACTTPKTIKAVALRGSMRDGSRSPLFEYLTAALS